MAKKINVDNLKLAYSDGRVVDSNETRRFVQKLEKMSKKYGGVTPEDFLTIFIKENGLKNGAILLDQKSKADTDESGGKAKGLIQFVPSTAKGLGLDQDKLSEMTATEQLDFVDKYYKDLGDPKNIKSFQDLYLGTFYPKALGEGDDFVIAKEGRRAYTANANIDTKFGDGDGVLTKGDFLGYANQDISSMTGDVLQEVSQEEYDRGYPEPNEVKRVNYVSTPDGQRIATISGEDGKTRRISLEGNRDRIRTIGDNDYLVSFNDKGDKSYKRLDVKDGRLRYNKVKVAPDQLYREEIANTVKDGVNDESLAKAKAIFETSEGDFEPDSKEFKEIGWAYYKKAKIPFIKNDIKRAREDSQDNIYDIEDELLTETDPVKRDQIRKELTTARKTLTKAKDAEETTNKLIEEVEDKQFYADTAVEERTSRVDEGVSLSDPFKERWAFDQFSGINDAYNQYIGTEDYVPEKADPEVEKIDKATTDRAKSEGVAPPVIKDKGNQVVDSDLGLTSEEQDILDAKKVVDTDALQQQIDLNNEALAEMKAQKPIDDSIVQGQDDTLENVLGYGSDIARGIIGLSGATEKLPEYERGAAFNEYLDTQRRFKDQGLTALEESVRKQRGERAYGFDVANIRSMGQGAGATLAAMGGAAGRLQDRYAEVGLEDAALKRQGRADFARAALTDEQINRQQFEDKFKVSMANKEAGAGLVRDAYTNLNERVAFNKAYGKGSQHYAYQDELMKSMKTNRELLKRGAENRRKQGVKALEESNIELQKRIDKANV